MFDLKKIERDLTPERVIELVKELGSDEYVEKQDYIQFKTICHNINPEDASLKLYYYKKNKKFHCYTGCGDNFNIFELFKRRYELLGIDYNFYNDIVFKIVGEKEEFFRTGFQEKSYESNFDKYKKNIIDVNIESLSPSLLNVFIFYPIECWLDDGINVESLKKYNILYSIKQNKIIIPHYDYDGNLIGIRGRNLNEEDLILGKYMPVSIEGKVYSHPLSYNLYGLNLVKDNIKRIKMAIVAEGEKSCLQYNTMFGETNNVCVSVCGSNFSSYQLELLLRAGTEKILIAFDKEGTDWKEKDNYFKKLKRLCLKYKNKCNMGFIYDSNNYLNLKESPFDKGKEIFLNLYKRATWV